MLASALVLASCGQGGESQVETMATEADHEHHALGDDIIELNEQQAKVLNIKTGPVQERVLGESVRVSGSLKVPPQNEATVTAIFGANVMSIEVIEGDDVKKGQVLAYLSHPNLTQFQSDYLNEWSQLQYLEKDYKRQEKLYSEEVASGKGYEQVKADYLSTKGKVASMESQLRQLGVDPSRIREGNFYDSMPVRSPITGSVTAVDIKTGQYVSAEKNLFEIINTDHIHADLMVFEKDVYKVEKGQQVEFTVKTLPDKEMTAKIFSVGKKFEEDPKAVHVHADITNKSGKLIPGMYISGRILTDSLKTLALPEDAVTILEDHPVAFMRVEDHNGNMAFTAVKINTGQKSDGWVEVSFVMDIPKDAQFALNNAYYLMAEHEKEELEHSH